MGSETGRLVTIITIVSSIGFGIFSFFSHVSNLDSSRRAEIDSVRTSLNVRERALADQYQRRYVEIIGRLSTNEAKIEGIEETIDRLGGLMLQEYGELLLRDRPPPETLGENGE